MNQYTLIPHKNDCNSILNKKISGDEILKMINKTKNGKASSLGDEYLKASKHVMLPVYEKKFLTMS